MTSQEYFEDLLQVLVDPAHELTSSRLSELSDLTSQQIRELRATWPRCGVDRRRHIVTELGRMAKESIEFLFEAVNQVALGDEDAIVRQAAIQNLWESESEAIASDLIRLAKTDPSLDVQLEAVRALGNFAYQAELGKLPRSLLLEIVNTLSPFLEREEVDPRLRRLALETLSHSSLPDLGESIRSHYGSDTIDDVSSSLVSMGRSADTRWEGQVLESLERPNPRVRHSAAVAAGELGLTASVTTLIELLDDPDQAVKQAAIWSLGQIGGDSARDALVDMQESGQDGELHHLIDDALDHIAFLDSTPDLALMDFEDSSPPLDN